LDSDFAMNRIGAIPEKAMKADLYEIKEFRNRHHVFKDRSEAGEALGKMLAPRYGDAEDLLILAIPSGGVPVGLKLRHKLNCPMDLLLVRKMQIPGNPEAGFGAMTLDGNIFLNESLLADLRLDSAQIEQQSRKVKADLEKRNTLFRRGEAPSDLKGKRIILVDDGLASGYTMMASISQVRKMGALRVVVAVPTAPPSSIQRIDESGVHEIFCPNIREGPFFAVAEAYEEWHDLSEEEVLRLLRESADQNRLPRFRQTPSRQQVDPRQRHKGPLDFRKEDMK
jgi:putative phosphoribosyl transferase